MADTTIKKIDSRYSPVGDLGQKYLASGIGLDMRLWEELPPGERNGLRADEYETVGYVVAGRAELILEGQVVLLEPGDSWVVPKGAEHSYTILETFTAVEAAHPPARVQGRDANR